jgi:hypothetical protein
LHRFELNENDVLLLFHVKKHRCSTVDPTTSWASLVHIVDGLRGASGTYILFSYALIDPVIVAHHRSIILWNCLIIGKVVVVDFPEKIVHYHSVP